MKYHRTTVLLPNSYLENLKLLKERDGMSMADMMRQALRVYLKEKGLDPEKIPVVTFTHRYDK